MAGRKARQAASTRNTTCLATATQTINAPKTTIRSRKNPVPWGSNTRGLLAGVWPAGWLANPGRPYQRTAVITSANVRDVTVSSPGEHAETRSGPAVGGGGGI